MAHRALLLLGIIIILLGGCAKQPDPKGAAGDGTGTGSTGQPAAGTEGTAEPEATGGRKVRTDIPLRVHATSSFRAALPALASRYRDTHDGKELAITFGLTEELTKQVKEAKNADLLILDDPDTVRALKEQGIIAHASVISAAQLVVITNAEKPTLLSVPEDLRKPEIKQIGIPALNTPGGKAAMAFLTEKTLLDVLQPKFKEYATVDEVVKAVGTGEVNLGFTYNSATRGRKQVRTTLSCGVETPPEFIAMPIAGSENEAGAEEFIKILQDATSITALTQAGFVETAARVVY